MKTLLLKLLATFNAKIRPFINLFIPILASNVAELLGALTPIALEVVASLADSPKTGAEKRKVAVDRITQAATTQGIKAGASVINTAIELALLNLRATGEAK